MFTLSAAPVTFVGLLVLFTFTTVWELYRLFRVRTRQARISSGLHLLMSIIMVMMIAKTTWMPFSKVIPLWAQIALMTLGTAWFAVVALRPDSLRRHGATRIAGGLNSHRAHALSCTAMFAAMVWHLAAMQQRRAHMGSHGSMAGGSWAEAAARPGGVLWWFAGVGLPLMAALLWIAVRDLAAAVREPSRAVDHLASFAMSFGMFWMSTGLLAPLLPWITALRF